MYADDENITFDLSNFPQGKMLNGDQINPGG